MAQTLWVNICSTEIRWIAPVVFPQMHVFEEMGDCCSNSTFHLLFTPSVHTLKISVSTRPGQSKPLNMSETFTILSDKVQLWTGMWYTLLPLLTNTIWSVCQEWKILICVSEFNLNLKQPHWLLELADNRRTDSLGQCRVSTVKVLLPLT